jgi:hypothetical protein
MSDQPRLYTEEQVEQLLKMEREECACIIEIHLVELASVNETMAELVRLLAAAIRQR